MSEKKRRRRKLEQSSFFVNVKGDVKALELITGGSGRRVRHDIAAVKRLWKGDHLAYAASAQQQRQKSATIASFRNKTLQELTCLSRARSQHAAARLFLVHRVDVAAVGSQRVECRVKLSPVDTRRVCAPSLRPARRRSVPNHSVVLALVPICTFFMLPRDIFLNPLASAICLQQMSVLVNGRCERMMRRHQYTLLLINFEQRKVHNPQQRCLILSHSDTYRSSSVISNSNILRVDLSSRANWRSADAIEKHSACTLPGFH